MYAGCINEKLRRRAEPYNGENAIAWSKRKQAVNAVFALPVVYFFCCPSRKTKCVPARGIRRNKLPQVYITRPCRSQGSRYHERTFILSQSLLCNAMLNRFYSRALMQADVTIVYFFRSTYFTPTLA